MPDETGGAIAQGRTLDVENRDYVFGPQPPVAIPITGSTAWFPVRRVWCVGRNYSAHAKEMGHDTREPPFFFSKQPDMLVPGGGRISYPSLTQNYHYEGELVVALKSGGANIAVADASRHIFGYAAGLDMTRRDLQKQMQEKGRPWEIGKSFDQSAPIGPLTPVSSRFDAGTIGLSVNNEVRQSSDVSQMTWNVEEVIAQLSRQVALAPGDIIFTGTPEGVGPVVPGDVVTLEIEGLVGLRVEIMA
ncbi:MAG TPA: fumarylacetoacetate hydrolase family protein [Rhizomicrobium sp.]|nr:fumarylacetoacetate hydrolase family protein [Rhizomicrobium sp.]